MTHNPHAHSANGFEDVMFIIPSFNHSLIMCRPVEPGTLSPEQLPVRGLALAVSAPKVKCVDVVYNRMYRFMQTFVRHVHER